MIKLTNGGQLYAKTCDLLNFAAELLGAGDATVTVICDARRIDMLGGEYKFDAALFSTPLAGTFNLYVRDLMIAVNPSIIFHEAVHLKQYLSGELVFDSRNGSCEWLGRAYAVDYPYRQRPWEREAFHESAKLLREWKSAQKPVCGVRKRLFGKNAK